MIVRPKPGLREILFALHGTILVQIVDRLPLAQEQGLTVMINLPFGRDRLFSATRDKPLPDWAAEIGATSWAQIFLKYVLSHPCNPIAIPGMAQARYADDNLGAARGILPDGAMRSRMERYIDAL